MIAELPGTDPELKDEVVMIGAHLDSWHTGVGATDNADGAATVMEAMRILKAIGAAAAAHDPRRAVGRRGAGAARVEGVGRRSISPATPTGRARQVLRLLQHRPGTGPIYGWYLQDNEPK